MEKIFHLSDFHSPDDTSRFALAMTALRENPNSTLIVEPRVYHITTELARETQAAVMNGEYGPNPQRTMFSPKFVYSRGISFAGQKGTTVRADGAIFEVDGFMEPVSLTDCEDVTVSGFTVRHRRKPYSKAVIQNIDAPDEHGNASCDLVFADDCPITLHTPLSLRCIIVDPRTGESADCGCEIREYVNEHLCRAVISNAGRAKEGFEYYTVHTFHFRPAILIERAKNIVIENVTLNNQPGMGIVGNRSENVTMRGLRVVPVDGDRWSTNTDATHFTSMTGTVRYENCLFDGQGDDSSNVHNYYQAVVGRDSDTVLYLQEKTPDGTHAQTLDYPDEGDVLEMTESDTMRVVDKFLVIACKPRPDEWMCRVTLDHAAPAVTEGLLFADVTRLPRLEVIGCHARNHFARGVLAKCRSGLIENNIFEGIHGPAIKLAAESCWYEGVCPAHFVIRGNRITNCGKFLGDTSGILVRAEAPNVHGQRIYDITIEDNVIDAPASPHGMVIGNVEGLRIVRNRVNSSAEPIIIHDCTDVTTEL